MIFRCKNCGANAVFSPEKQTMYCPYCDSIDSEEPAEGEGMNYCINCGGELHAGDYSSAVKCEHCGSYVIFEERTSGSYEPHLILPFKLGKKQAQDLIKKEFGKKPFVPDDFLSEAKMSEMEGAYVPFFMYDYACRYKLSARGNKVRTWRSGNTEYTETSVYDVYRDMDVSFEKIPVDASIAMNDEMMDLMEPYDYAALIDFQTKYMSGFLAEKYNMSADELEVRARTKAKQDAEALMNETLVGYTTVTDKQPDMNLDRTQTNYSLLPVWRYTYTYKDKTYPFYINGQTGKMTGNPPISMAKVVGYGATVFFGMLAAGGLLNLILGVL